MLGRFTDLADDFIFVIDQDLFYRYVNRSLAALFGRSPQEMTGRHVTEFFPPDSLGIFQRHLRTIFKSPETLHFTERLFLANSCGQMWFDVRLTPILDRDGTTKGVLGIARDVTEDRETEERLSHSKREWEQAVDGMPYLMAISDTRFRIRKVNQAMADRLGVTVQAAVGLTCYELLRRLSEPPSFCPLVRAASGKRERRWEFIERCDDGVQLVTVCSLKDRHGKLAGCLYMVSASRGLPVRERETPASDRETMELLLRQADHIIAIQNKKGRYVFLSSIPPSSVPTHNLLGKTPLDIFDTALATQMLERVKRVAASGVELRGETHVSCDGEKTLCFHDQVSPIRDGAGHILAVVTISRRISGPHRSVEHRTGCVDIQGLTARESEVLGLIASGLTNKQIAEKLFISKKTVETHRARIMQKLDLHKSSALVRYALSAGII